MRERATILLADDDSEDMFLTEAACRQAGLNAELRWVENGDELIDYLYSRGRYAGSGSQPRPSLILLDLNMPKVDGREVLGRIKSDPGLRAIPVVVFTTSWADDDVRRSYQAGANSFLTKPPLYGDLVEAMKAIGAYWLETIRLPPLTVTDREAAEIIH